MHAVVLTFPGHFFQTMLCLRSLRRFYSNLESIQIIADDHAQAAWTTYVDDWTAATRHNMPWLPWNNISLIKASTLDIADPHYSGWWRQQMIKLHLDEICDHDAWLVVDGDVVFDTGYVPNTHIPVSLSDRDPNLDATSCLTANYVKHMLGVDQGYLVHQGQYAMTNPIPFRKLNRAVLQNVRNHVENLHGTKFQDLHKRLIDDKKIVAFQDPPVGMIMSEWELIEGYRHWIQGQQHFDILGSGYPIMMHTSHLYTQSCVFRHGYCRDTEIEQSWWRHQGIATDDYWPTAQAWLISERTSA